LNAPGAFLPQASGGHVSSYENAVIATRRSGMMSKLMGVAVVGVLAAAAGSAMADGKDVYDKTCGMCHAAGVANAPKLGDKAAWGPRVAQGVPAMVATVIKGKGAMPPKAGNAALTETDIKSAVEYMLAQVK
jgi:cytochrome c5